jgi:glycosyltransferase involved in cell wall biosynthesis
MKKQFSISVIMPVYNCEKYLSQAIESVYAQGDFVDSEIIVIDDGSSDNSVLIANKYNTKVIKQNHLHAAAARNNGIKNSSKD